MLSGDSSLYKGPEVGKSMASVGISKEGGERVGEKGEQHRGDHIHSWRALQTKGKGWAFILKTGRSHRRVVGQGVAKNDPSGKGSPLAAVQVDLGSQMRARRGAGGGPGWDGGEERPVPHVAMS